MQPLEAWLFFVTIALAMFPFVTLALLWLMWVFG